MTAAVKLEVDVKQAVRTALEFFRELYAEERLPDIRVEEVLLSADESEWEITVGYSRPETVGEYVDRTLQKLPPRRDYKRLAVDTMSGRVKRMMMRDLIDVGPRD
jgi:hypothetical protein